MSPYLYAFPLLANTVVCLYLAYLAIRRLPVLGAVGFVSLMLAAAWWSGGYALELVTPDLAGKLLWAKVQYAGIASIMPAWAVFAARYSGMPRRIWHSWPALAVLTILPLATFVLALTNEWHHLIWQDITLQIDGAIPMLHVQHGAWFWVHWAYSIILMFLGTSALAGMLFRSLHIYRRQSTIILLGTLAPCIGNLLYVLGLRPLSGLDLTPFAFTITGMAYAWSVFRLRMLDVAPIARQTVLDGLGDPVLVLDSRHHIVDLNPAARRLAESPGVDLIGRPVHRVLGQHAARLEPCLQLQTVHSEIDLDGDGLSRPYDMHATPLLDGRRECIGTVVVLRDIADRVQAQAALQRAKDELDRLVAERTAALRQANDQLENELVGRRYAEERYRILFEDAPVMYVITRREQQGPIIADCNAQFLSRLGYTREEVIGRPLADFYSPASRAELQAGYSRALQGVVVAERQLVARDGLIVETQLQAVAETDTEGNVVGTRAMFADLTEHKQAERQFRDLLEAAPDGMVIADSKGRIVLVNTQTERMFGYSRQELIDRHFAILLPEHSRERYIQLFDTDRERLLVRRQIDHLDTMGRRQDGSEFPAEVSLTSLETAQGIVVCGAIRDVSERKQAEATLREREALLRDVLENSQDAIYRRDVINDRFDYFSPAIEAIAGYAPHEIVGQSYQVLAQLVHPDDLPLMNARTEAVLQNNTSRDTDEMEYRLRTKSGDYVWLSNNRRVVRDAEGRPVAMVGGMRDITERKQGEERQARLLQEISEQREHLRALAERVTKVQEQERQDLARELHDEVGRNLTALDFHLQLVRNGLEQLPCPDDRLQSHLEDAGMLLGETAELVRDVMAQLRPSVLDDYGLLAALRWYGNRFVAPLHLPFSVEGQEPDPRLAPPVASALFRIAQEAITNVIKHARASHLRMALHEDPAARKLYLVVADDGVGFARAARGTVPGETTEPGPNTPASRPSWGLLNMTERALAIGGRLRVESEPGKGTRIVVEVDR